MKRNFQLLAMLVQSSYKFTSFSALSPLSCATAVSGPLTSIHYRFSHGTRKKVWAGSAPRRRHLCTQIKFLTAQLPGSLRRGHTILLCDKRPDNAAKLRMKSTASVPSFCHPTVVQHGCSWQGSNICGSSGTRVNLRIVRGAIAASAVQVAIGAVGRLLRPCFLYRQERDDLHKASQ